jgi:hypothetical protein
MRAKHVHHDLDVEAPVARITEDKDSAESCILDVEELIKVNVGFSKKALGTNLSSCAFFRRKAMEREYARFRLSGNLQQSLDVTVPWI